MSHEVFEDHAISVPVAELAEVLPVEQVKHAFFPAIQHHVRLRNEGGAGRVKIVVVFVELDMMVGVNQSRIRSEGESFRKLSLNCVAPFQLPLPISR